MIALLSKFRRPVFIGTVLIFLVGIFVGLGAYVFDSSASDSVAEVNGQNVSYQRFNVQVNRVMNSLKGSGSEVNEVLSRTVKQEIFRDMVIEELLSQQGDKFGMLVPDFEIAMEIQNTPQFRDGNAFSPRAYYQTVFGEFSMAPAEYEAWRKKARLATKFKQFIFTAAKVTPLEVAEYAAAKKYKDLDKNRAKYTDELAREKFANIANHLLRQLTSKQEVKSFLEQREKGR
jgi:hypothetical protein